MTRCLKGVIIEQNEMKNTNSVTTNKEDSLQFEEQMDASTRSNNVSPVYSLPDLDKTFYSESQVNHEVVNKNEAPANEISVIDLCEDTDFEQDETELTEKSHPIISVDIDIQRVLSNMSIRTNNEVQESETLVENDSQSILENDKHFDKSTEINKEILLNDKLITETSIDQQHNDRDGANVINKTSTEILTINNLQPSNTLAPEISNKNDHNGTSQSKSLIGTNVANIEIKQKIPQIKKITDDKQENKVKKKKKQSKKAVNNHNALISKHNVPCVERRIGDVIMKPLKSVAPKLKQITEDLSWVEKITYVRKVSTSEYDSRFVISDESFWENCTLPENWNDQEFV